MLLETPAWQALHEHKKWLETQSLAALHAQNTDCTLQVGELTFDYRAQWLTPKTLPLLCALAEQSALARSKMALFSGDPINITEDRPALHMLLRHHRSPYYAQHATLAALQHETHRWQHAVTAMQQQTWRGCTNLPFTDIVHIGVGGSEMGPRLLWSALAPYRQYPYRMHFIANLDPFASEQLMPALNPATTLVILASKSMATQETLCNAAIWLAWLRAHNCTYAQHVVAITENTMAAAALEMPAANIFTLWPWVGGRYSVWSAIALGAALCLGLPTFEAFLEGARLVDQHFETAPFACNAPDLLGTLYAWMITEWGTANHCVLPYAEALRELPAYLQQLCMESLGKRTTQHGEPIPYATGVPVFGGVGTTMQHSLGQWLQQSSAVPIIDFIVCKKTAEQWPAHQQWLHAHSQAQQQLLTHGTSEDNAHQTLPGNKPSLTITMDALTPEALGSLLAFYEHRVFVAATLWSLNPFDQEGVIQGKRVAKAIFHRTN